MDDLDKLLNDLQDNPINNANTKAANASIRPEINLSEFENIIKLSENALSGKGNTPRSTKTYQASAGGGGISLVAPRTTSLSKKATPGLDNTFKNSQNAESSGSADAPIPITSEKSITITAERLIAAKKVLTAMSSSSASKAAANKFMKTCTICGQGIQKSGAILNGILPCEHDKSFLTRRS